MAFEQKEGSGALFKNDQKESAKHPDYRGDCRIGGVDYWLSAWIKEGKKGKWMSIALQPKSDAKGRQQGGRQAEDDRDSPPF